MDFPITELMDQDACYAKLVEWLHPDGFACPRCHEDDRMGVYRSRRPPALDFRCGHCGRVFTAFTDTPLHGIKRRPVELVLIVRGLAQGVSTAQVARELERDRSEFLNLRHRLQVLAFWDRDRMPLDDTALEADEAYQLERDRSEFLNLRHRLQVLAFWDRDRMPLDDTALEADEAYQNAGEKRRSAMRSG